MTSDPVNPIVVDLKSFVGIGSNIRFRPAVSARLSPVNSESMRRPCSRQQRLETIALCAEDERAEMLCR